MMLWYLFLNIIIDILAVGSFYEFSVEDLAVITEPLVLPNDQKYQ